VWDSLASDAADIEALAVFPELRRAYDEGLVDSQFMAPEELEEAESAPRGRMLEAMRTRRPPIDDVAAATSWWPALGEGEDEDTAIVEPQEPYRAPQNVGRNDPCPCGSGKKYKKCCGG